MQNYSSVLHADMSQPEDYVPNLVIHEFRSKFKGDFFSTKTECRTEMSILEFITQASKAIKNIEGKSKIESIMPDNFIIYGNANIIVHVYMYQSYSNGNKLWTTGRKQIIVMSFGNPDFLKRFHDNFLQKLTIPETPSIYWKYVSEGRTHEKRVPLNPPRNICKEYYPWLKEDPYEYIDRFLASDTGLIILRGEPGTGKTSFIHNILWRSGMHAAMTYDEILFKSDEMFVDFLTGDSTNLLIMEDADAMLTSREREGNPLMNKFLNISDGLIRFPDKKIIISANIIENHRIDSALLRPGRCFDTPVFHKLSYVEACAAADVAGIAHPEKNDKNSGDMTLAELFNADGGSKDDVVGKKVGFI